MNRNFKALGLALVAMLTMGIAAASASAADFHSESVSTTISGAQSSTNTITTDSGTFHCSTMTFIGTQSGATASNVVVAPTYTGCKTTGFIEANVTMDINGCDYNITETGSVHLETCNAGKAGIVTTAPFCTITIPSGQTWTSVGFSNSGSGTTQEVTMDAGISNINYSESGFACKNSGSNTTGGTYDGNVLFTATSGGNHTGIWWE